MTLNPLMLSNNFIERALESGASLSPMKLQKILYFTYREYIKAHGEPIFSERFGTWKYGPVLESVYHEFKHYGSASIKNYDAMFDDGTGEIKAFKINEKAFPALAQVINSVWQSCKDRSGIELSELTHKQGSAWYNAFQNYASFLNDDDIKNDNIPL